MIATTANFQAAAAKLPSRQVYRFSIEGYSKVFVYRKTGRSGELAWITNIQDWGVSVDPLNGSYTIDDLVISVLNPGAAVTADTSLLLLEQRFCTLQLGYDGLDISDYCVLFQGIVSTVEANPDGSYSFTCNDFNRLNQRVIYVYGDDGTVTTTTTTFAGANPWTTVTQTNTTDPTTGVVTPSAVITYGTVDPSNGPVGTVINGNVTTVTTSRTVQINGVNTTIYETVVTTLGDTVTTIATTTYGGMELFGNVIVSVQTQFTTGLVTTSLSITFTENGPVGVTSVTDSAIITSSNPKHLVGHPLDMLLEILQVEIDLADSDINIALIEAYRDSVWSGTEFEFYITGSVDAKDFMENQLLKPLGGYLYTNASGQICVGFAQPLPGSIVSNLALTPSNIASLPTVQTHDLTNVLTLRFDKDDFNISTVANSTGYLAQSNTFYAPSIEDLPDLSTEVATELVAGSGAVQGQLIIESDGMRSGFQGFVLSAMVANSIFALYGSYNPTMQVDVLWNPAFSIELAEYVTVTHPLLPNRKLGVMGMVNQLFKVTARSYSFDSMVVTLTLEDASGISAFTAKRIRSAGNVAIPGGPTVGAEPYVISQPYEQQRYIYMSDITSKQSNGDPAARLG